jgi:hypothetical protein
MADYFYAVNKGNSDNPQGVTVGTATANLDIELHVNTTHTPTKKDVIRALRTFEQLILGNGVGTATGPGVDQLPL